MGYWEEKAKFQEKKLNELKEQMAEQIRKKELYTICHYCGKKIKKADIFGICNERKNPAGGGIFFYFFSLICLSNSSVDFTSSPVFFPASIAI